MRPCRAFPEELRHLISAAMTNGEPGTVARSRPRNVVRIQSGVTYHPGLHSTANTRYLASKGRKWPIGETMQSGQSGGARLRLIIADDHDLLRDGIRSRLSDEEFVDIVGEARNGREAVELCLQLQPDMVLLDISMPELNGLEAAMQIKQNLPEIKILFLSIYDNEEYVREALRIGANGFVLKDVSKAEMINAIKSVALGATYLGPQAAASLAKRPMSESEQSGDFGLTSREKEVLAAVSKGFTNREIALQMTISVRTVESHRLSIREKTGGGNAVALSKIAGKLGL